MIILIMLGILSSSCLSAEGRPDEGEMLKFNENGRWKNLEWTNRNGIMEYIVPSPGTSTLGYLEKDITFEGCEDRGCRILMTFEKKEFFFNKTLEEVYNKVEKKITIDVSDIEEIKEKRKNACHSLLITIYLDFDFKGNRAIERKKSCGAKERRNGKDISAGGELLHDEKNRKAIGTGTFIRDWEGNLVSGHKRCVSRIIIYLDLHNFFLILISLNVILQIG